MTPLMTPLEKQHHNKVMIKNIDESNAVYAKLIRQTTIRAQKNDYRTRIEHNNKRKELYK